MARTRTLLQLRTECRQRTEMEGSTFVSDAELTRYLNQSIAKLYGKLVRARGDQYYRDSFSTTTTPGSSGVVLPATFFKLIGVDVQLSGLWRSLDPIDWSARSDYLNAGSVSTVDGPLGYDLARDQVNIAPTPSSAFPVVIHFVPYATELVLDADAFDGINGWEGYAVADACVAMLAKEDSDTRALVAELEQMDALIDELAGTRDEGTAWRVQRRWRSRRRHRY